MDELTQGRLHGIRPIAVIDIGSNSIRLVVYEGLVRSPTPLFQEKAMCGLGRYLTSTRRLNEETIPHALAALARFRKLAEICGVRERDMHPFATAAVRWAEDGQDFLARAEEACGATIEVIGNAQEAELAATGVMAGFVNPSGIVGDLGGGSLELIRIRDGRFHETVSLPLGGLALLDATQGEKMRAAEMIDSALQPLTWLETHGVGEDQTFYAVGGTWRTLAKMHMHQTGHPLTAVHGYRLDTRKAQQITARYGNMSASVLSRMDGMSAGREETAPFGALLLNAIVRKMQPSSVVFSAFGVREGTIYRLMGDTERAKDPLLSACWEVSRLRSRSAMHARELIDWTDMLFETTVTETPEERRLRHAACLLSDVAWRAHPDYRGEQSAALIAQAALVGIDHPGRAFLALSVYHRYERKLQGELLPKLSGLIPRHERARALAVGQSVRLAHTLSAGMAGVLAQTELVRDGGKLVLRLPSRLRALDGEPLRRRLRFVARELGLQPDVKVVQRAEPQKQSLFRSLMGRANEDAF